MRRRGPSRRGSRQGASRSRSKRRGPPWWGAQRQARSAEGHATRTSAEGWGPQEMDGYQAETNSNAPSLYAQSKGQNGWPMKNGVGCCNPRISNGASPTGCRWPTARVWRLELEISVSLRILFGPPAVLSARAGAGAGDAERGGAAGGPSNLASPRSSSTPPCSSRLSSARHLRPKLESRATTFH